MTASADHRLRDTLARFAPALLVIGLAVFHAVNNWIWLDKNLVVRGWDPIGSLVNSLYYHETLSGGGLQALFDAITQDYYRPPLFGLSMAAMYRLFGISADIAVMANTLYLFVLLAASYGIGARLGGRRLGMLSAILVALIPLVFAMSRYPYFEFALTALTALSIYLLLATESFEKWGFSVLLGLSLGLGALVKRTFPLFVLGAVAVVFFQAGLPRKLWTWLKSGARSSTTGKRPRWRHLGIALVGGGLLAALWYFPNHETAQTFPAGFWLFPLWWLLAAVAIFFLLQPSSPATNALTALFVSIAVGSVWYLPHGFEFIKQILWLAWGIEDPRGRTVDFASLSTYTDYLQSFLYGFSPIYSFLLVLALGLLLVSLIRHRRRFLPVPWWDWKWWAIIATLVVAYMVLSTSIYKEHRAITPLLPLLGVILAGALLVLPWRRVRSILIALAVIFGVVQFFAISYTGPHRLVEQTAFKQPILGQWSVFAQGQYLETPDSSHNDPRFWIAEDVLQHVEAARQRENWDTISLGVIAYSSYVHVGMFAYDQLRLYPSIQLDDPTQTYPQESAYSTAFRYDYVVVLQNKNRRPAVQEAEALILEERRAAFEQGFELEGTYPLPDGSEAYLFRRRYRSTGDHDGDALYQVAQYLHQEAGGADLIVVHPPGLVSELLEYYWGQAPVLTLAEVASSEPPARLFLLFDGQARDEVQNWLEAAGLASAPAEEIQFGDLRLLVIKD